MFSSIFIKRPILATVISLVLVLAGAISVKFLPIAEYPLVSPPTVLVIAHYPGASSQTIAETVAAPIEAQINSVENLIYYSSTCGNDGTYELNVTFEPGSDEDMTLVNVNNAIKLAEHSLPSEVVQNGLIVVKRSPDILSVISVRSSRHSLLDISNWTDIHILDAIQRIEGVGQAVIFGEMKYSMRVWLDPEKMRSMGISPGEVRAAIASQNVQAATGAIGTEYSGNLMQFKVDAKGRLTEPAEYEKIVVRASADGLRQVRLGDIARVELGSETYEGVGRYQGEPSIALAIFKLNHGNALEIQKNIKATMEEIEKTMPDGMHWEFAYDTTRFVNASMKEIVETLLLTFILVVVITWLFLQSWRATIIPAVAIPVSLIGTFLFMHVIGMSINTLTMFALILVIGSVVDDAICVTESCVRMIVEEHKKPLQAAFDTMKQITGALIATTLVVLAVYAPIAFAGGMVGTIYLQFSVTMCVALCLSTLCALTLSPAVAALILKEPKEPTGFMKVVTAPLAAFDWGIRWLRRVYERASGFLIRWMWLTLIVFAAIVAFDVWVFTRVPGGFLPEEDKGTVIAEVALPPGASLARTEKVLSEVGTALGKIPGVATILEVPHHSLTSGTGENVGMVIMELEDWSKRRGPGLDIKSIQDQAMAVGSQFPDAQVLALVPPPIQGLGDSGGVTFALQAVAGQSFRELSEAANRLVRRIMQSGKAMYAFTSFDCSTPMVEFKLDRAKAEAMGVPVSDVFNTLQAQLGSFYVNDFNKFGKTYQVKIQAKKEGRATMASINSIYVTGRNGAQIPISALGTFEWTLGSRQAERFNMFSSAAFTCQGLPGVSSGEMMRLCEELKDDELGKDYALAWKDMSYQEKRNEGAIVWLLGLSLLMAYLFLAAQYESWTVPVSVILSIATAVGGGLAALKITGHAMDIYGQLGLLMLIGLTAKTAILMVEFAKQRRDEGVGIYRASVTGLRMRFRAVLMTALSFVIGVMPLLYATGAGAGARVSVGTVTFWGMLVATVAGMLLVPPLYVCFQRISEFFMGPPRPPEEN